MSLPSVEERPTLSVPEAGRLLAGLSRSTSYELAARGEFPVPVFRVGALLRVPTAAVLRLLEVDEPGPEGDAEVVPLRRATSP